MVNPFDRDSAQVGVPVEITQGSFVHWFGPVAEDIAVMRYEYVLKRQDDKQVRSTTVAVAADGYVSLTTANWTIGKYNWMLYAVRVSDDARATIATGTLVVKPDALSSVDMRTHEAIMLTKIRGLLEGRADSDIASYTIGNRQVSKMSIKELTSWYNHYKLLVDQQEAGPTSGQKNRIRVRFV